MVKFIYALLFCYALILYCCWDRNPMSEGTNSINGSNTTSKTIRFVSQKNINKNIHLTVDEQQKFNAFKSGIDIMIKIAQERFKNKETLKQYEIKQLESILNKSSSFMNWLLTKHQKQKELANAFTTVYNFLDNQRLLQSSPLTTEQLLINTMKCGVKFKNNDQCNDNKHVYIIPDIDISDKINEFFYYLV